MQENYEIEVKSLLVTKEKADSLREAILNRGGKKVEEEGQLNHYFLVSDLSDLNKIKNDLQLGEKEHQFNKIILGGHKVSVRTREKDKGKAIFVIKASVDDTTSENGISRIELEKKTEMTIDELDGLLLGSGLTYQSKWSRFRELYKLDDMEITIDKNAGYGYMAEFEIAVDEKSKIGEAKKKIDLIMKELDSEELPQDRLERMFEFYNKNWRDYYGTDKTFVIN